MAHAKVIFDTTGPPHFFLEIFLDRPLLSQSSYGQLRGFIPGIAANKLGQPKIY